MVEVVEPVEMVRDMIYTEERRNNTGGANVMNLEHLSDWYYTAAEARAVLGLNENTFQTWVKTGKIKRTRLPGRGQGLYLKREIDRKAQLIEAALFLDTTKELEYKTATRADVDAELHLSHLIYGKRRMTPEVQRAIKRLIEINPESCWHLYDRELLAASLTIAPFAHSAIEAFQQGKRGWFLTEEPPLQQFEPGSPRACVILEFMTTPTVPPEKRNFYGQALLREFATVSLKAWGARGVEISKVYACGSTGAGRNLLRGSRAFGELGEPVPGRVIFELDVQRSTLILLHPYKEALAVWKAQHARS